MEQQQQLACLIDAARTLGESDLKCDDFLERWAPSVKCECWQPQCGCWHPLLDIAEGAPYVMFSTRIPHGRHEMARDHDVLLGFCADGPAVVEVTMGGEHLSTHAFGSSGGFKYAISDAFFLPTVGVQYSSIYTRVYADVNAAKEPAVYAVKAFLETDPRRALVQNGWWCGKVPFPYPPDWFEALPPRVHLPSLRAARQKNVRVTTP